MSWLRMPVWRMSWAGGGPVAQVAGLLEGPLGRDPLRHQRVECAFRFASGQVVDYPPGDLAVGAGAFGWVDVDAAEEDRFVLVQ